MYYYNVTRTTNGKKQTWNHISHENLPALLSGIAEDMARPGWIGDAIKESLSVEPIKEKAFSVKAEYADKWTEGATYPLIVTESEISRLAAEWGVSFCELLDQVDEIDND